MNQSIRLKRRTPVFLVALTWFVLSPTSQALLPPPPPDGGYPNNNTAEGTDALFNVTFGTNDTAVGAGALQFDTSGLDNTAIGSFALRNNTVGSGNTACGNKTLQNNTGSSNTAIGSLALQLNTTGYDNTATGFEVCSSHAVGEVTATHVESVSIHKLLPVASRATVIRCDDYVALVHKELHVAVKGIHCLRGRAAVDIHNARALMVSLQVSRHIDEG